MRRMVGDVVLLFPRPAFVGPPLAPLVAAALDEAHPARGADGPARDLERLKRDRVARALVVVGEPARGGAHRERARGDLQPLLLLGRERRLRRDRRRLARGQQAGERQRLAHRLGVLQLVADHHLAHVPVAHAAPRDRLGDAVRAPRACTRARPPAPAPRCRRAPRGASRTRRTARQVRRAAAPAPRAGAPATGPRRRRCDRDPTRAGS